MNQAQSKVRETSNDDEFKPVEAMIVLAKHKKLVTLVPLVTAIAATVVSFVLPDTYTASTKLLPPQQATSGAAALLQQLGGVAGVAAGAAGLKNPNDLYVGMLKSRTVADRLIAKFDMKKLYDVELLQDARKELEDNTTILSGKDGLISIDVDDHDSKRSAQIANAYVQELLTLTSNFAVTEAAQRRVFFERQLEQTKNNLAKAEMALKSGLDKRGVISVDVESEAMIETVGRLKAQVSAKEIELRSMGAFVTSSNPDYKRTQEELNSLRVQLSKLENGRGADEQEGDGKRNVGLENIKLLRDVKYNQMLYEMLAKQYEFARLDEAKDSSLIQVLDAAVAPEKKSKPKRPLIVILSTVFAFFVSAGLAFFQESRRKSQASGKDAAQWDELKALLRAK
jgi:tyrosine-protein kinase Etk/Wzc